MPVRPNPFNLSATIPFSLPSDGHAVLVVYNLAGQRVRTLVDRSMNAGYHHTAWDGRDDAGNEVTTGVYITRLTLGSTIATGKMVLVK